MKKILNIFISMQSMAALLIIFATSMAVATFVENDFGAIASKAAIYNTWWFNLILFLLSVNMIGNIFIYKLYSLKKLPMFTFHVAFIIIIAGAAVTRFISYEGMMHIRENDSSNKMVTSNTFISIDAQSGNEKYNKVKTVYFSAITKNRFKDNFKINGKKVTVKTIRYIQNTGKQQNGLDACLFEVTVDGNKQKVKAWGKSGTVQKAQEFTFNDVQFKIYYGSMYYTIPFSIALKDFQLERYPGSNSPSSYASEVILIDKEKQVEKPFRIYMNHVLDYRGYRFFQSSYDQDEKGTILSVNHDKAGTLLTYLGYILLAVGMLFTLFSKSSRFLAVAKESSNLHLSRIAKTVLLGIFLGSLSFSPATIYAQKENVKIIDASHAKKFGELLVLDRNGRIKPMNTMTSEVLRKVARKDRFLGMNSDQVFLSMISDPVTWQNTKMIRISDPELKDFLKIDGKFASYADMIDQESNQYLLGKFVNAAYNKKPSMRNKFDKYVMKVDERMNVCYMVYMGNFLNIFPVPNDPNQNWASVNEHKHDFVGEDSIFVANIFSLYINSLQEAVKTGDYNKADENLDYIKKFQQKYAASIIPSQSRIKFEIWYNHLNLFERISFVYGIIGFVMLIALFMNVLIPTLKVKLVVNISTIIIFVSFILHTMGLLARWYVAGHAPWSNGYESMIYISWATVLAGFIFMKRSPISLSATSLLAFLILFVAHMNWLDPQITNLVPVLNSYWLSIHVAIITASYGFLALGSLIGFLVLLLMIFRTNKNAANISLTIKELGLVNEMTLTVGLFLLTIGTFLGGVWANESWGRYWGWDPKETWALITVIVYSFIVHMRLIPGLKGTYSFNVASILGYGSVIMTYFGVNYYLSGLHSYASGDPVPVPVFVYYTIAIVVVVAIVAYLNERKYKDINEPTG
ncbi:MAG: cytochrome c biogenesis protein CcsA [Chlorobi bacterium]|nr:cytochrome c biogenesis protein CcsA [Chlorobiota bacterium]